MPADNKMPLFSRRHVTHGHLDESYFDLEADVPLFHGVVDMADDDGDLARGRRAWKRSQPRTAARRHWRKGCWAIKMQS